MASLCHIPKKKKNPENSFLALLCLQRIKHNLYWKIKFLKQPACITYVIAKISKFVKVSMHTSSDSFLQKILWKLKGLGTSLQATFFIKVFDQNLSFVILHKLAKFYYQTVFTFQVIQENVFHVSCLGIWWRHDIWISKKLNLIISRTRRAFRTK